MGCQLARSWKLAATATTRVYSASRRSILLPSCAWTAGAPTTSPYWSGQHGTLWPTLHRPAQGLHRALSTEAAAVAQPSPYPDPATLDTADQLDLMAQAMHLRQGEASWRLYLANEPYVPISYRVQLAMLLQDLRTASANRPERARRLEQMLVEWPPLTQPEGVHDSLLGRRVCLRAYLAVVSGRRANAAEHWMKSVLHCPPPILAALSDEEMTHPTAPRAPGDVTRPASANRSDEELEPATTTTSIDPFEDNVTVMDTLETAADNDDAEDGTEGSVVESASSAYTPPTLSAIQVSQQLFKDARSTEAMLPNVAVMEYIMRVHALAGSSQRCRDWKNSLEQTFALRANAHCWHWLVLAYMREKQFVQAAQLLIHEMPTAQITVLNITWLVAMSELRTHLLMDRRWEGLPMPDAVLAQTTAVELLLYIDRICANAVDNFRVRCPLACELSDEQHEWVLNGSQRLLYGVPASSVSAEYPVNEEVMASAMELALSVQRPAIARRFRARANLVRSRRFSGMDARRLSVSTSALHKEIYYWCSYGRYDHAKVIWQRLPHQYRFHPRLVSALMKTARYARQPLEAIRIFRKARASRLTHLNKFIWTNLIAAHAERMDLPAAHDAFKEMQNFGITANAYAYTALLVAYGRCGELQQAEALLREMLAQQVSPTHATRCALADTFAKLDDVERVVGLLLARSKRSMLARNSAGDGHPSVDLEDAGTADKVATAVTALDCISLNTVMSALNRAGQPHDVLRLWHIAYYTGVGGGRTPLQHHQPPDVDSAPDQQRPSKRKEHRTWNFSTLCIVLDTCTWHDLPEQGELVWRQALETVMSRDELTAMRLPDRERPSLATIEERVLRQRRYNNAPASRLPSTTTTTTTIISARPRLSVRCYYSYIHLLGQSGRTLEIPHVFQRMIEYGTIPNRPILLLAVVYLMEADAVHEIETITQLVYAACRYISLRPEQILPTEESIAEFIRHRHT